MRQRFVAPLLVVGVLLGGMASEILKSFPALASSLSIFSLPGVTLTSLANGDVLSYNSSTKKFVNAAAAACGTCVLTGDIGTSGLTMATGKVLGRTTAGTGAVEELTTLPSSLTIPSPSISSPTLSGTATVTGGSHVTAHSIGTVSSGTTTIDCGNAPLQYLTDGGAFTLAAPANDSSCVVLVTNNGSAGTITFSGFSVGATTGDTLTTTDTQKFSLSIWRINGTSGYRVAAHQ